MTGIKNAVHTRLPHRHTLRRESRGAGKWKKSTSCKSLCVDGEDGESYSANGGDPVDLLQFSPMSMDNDVYSIRTVVEMSVMSMGQDQRHRTLSRGRPLITGDFYLPPLLRMAGMERTARNFQKRWAALMNANPRVANFTAPYGAMAKCQKRSPLNALLHEQEKRLCWCSQEEIYNLNARLARQLADALRPWCAKHGKCLEGRRYCGHAMNPPDYFSQRQI